MEMVLFGRYRALQERADRAEKLLLSKREAEDFLEMLPKVSKQTGNILTSITPKDSHSIAPASPKNSSDKVGQEPSPLTKISEMPVGITISGGYSEIIDLFKTLEGFKELMVVDDVGLTGSSKSRSSVEAKFSLNLIHTRSDINTPASAELPLVLTNDEVAKAAQVATAADAKPQETPVEPLKPVIEAPKSLEEQQNSSKKQSANEIESNVYYTVQVGVFDIVENSKALSEALKLYNYEAWVRPHLLTNEPPHYVLVGRFGTKKEAVQFGEEIKSELPLVNEYVIKQAAIDKDTLLRKTSTEN